MTALIERFPTLSARWAAFSQRERILIAVAAAAFALFLLYMLAPSGEEPGVELAEDIPPAEAQPAFVPPPAPAAAAPAPAAAPPASTEGLVLHGVLGGGPGGGAAIIGMPGGGQRAIRVGRQFLPGLTLKEVGLAHAVIATSGGDFRLQFGKPAESIASAPAPAPAAAGPADERRRRETLQFRTGLEERTANGRVTGFALKPGADLPLLERAGLQPGDVIVAVNGQAFRSSEKVMELSDELASSYSAKIDFIRNGRRMSADMAVNNKSQ